MKKNNSTKIQSHSFQNIAVLSALILTCSIGMSEIISKTAQPRVLGVNTVAEKNELPVRKELRKEVNRETRPEPMIDKNVLRQEKTNFEQHDSREIKVSTFGAQRVLLQKGAAGAITHFPISVDQETNTLTITTPSGNQNTVILPQKAIQNMVESKMIDRLHDQKEATVSSESTGSAEEVIELKQENDKPVYIVNGISDQKLFGLIPVKIKKGVSVSAETGEMVSAKATFFTRIVDIFSF